MGEREPGPRRWLVVLAAPMALAVLSLSAIATNAESRQDFIDRWKFGPLPDAPDFDPDFRGPEFNLPNAPQIDGPDLPAVEAPSFLGVTLEALAWLTLIGLVLLVIAGIALHLAGVRLPGRRRRGVALADDIDLDAGGTDYSGAGWQAFEAFLAELSADPDPSRAVRVGFRYAETGFGSLPPRLIDETPNEWERRTAEHAPGLVGTLTPLIDRYNNIRFVENAISPAERDQSIIDLRALAHRACRVAPTVPEMVVE